MKQSILFSIKDLIDLLAFYDKIIVHNRNQEIDNLLLILNFFRIYPFENLIKVYFSTYII